MRVPTTHGSSAYKYERTYTQPQKKVRKSVKKKPVTKGLGKNIFAYVTIMALAFILLFRYASITEMSNRLTSLKSEYDEVSSVVVSKEFELEKYVDLNKVEDIATNELGMRRPEKHQMVYVDMHNEDYTEKVGVDTESGGFFAAISGAWERLWEYFS